MMKIAVLGASGFIGTRSVELLHLKQVAQVVPVVRTYASLARIARFDLDSRLADARDEEALCRAFAGCDYVIHAALGDLATITDSVEPVYKAACRAGVKRLVYLSSTAVHGLAPEPGTDENSSLSKRQTYAYSKAKIVAEERLLNARRRATGEKSTELVILRPGIVYGPRSGQWIGKLADDLLQGRAYLANDGQGICNCIYVDNLLEAILLSLKAEGAKVDGEVFLVSDKENVTWKQFYEVIASALPTTLNSIYYLSENDTELALKRTWRDLISDFRSTPLMQKILPFFPGSLKVAVKKIVLEKPQVHDLTEGQETTGLSLPVKPAISSELITLQMSQYKLPYSKAEALLGYQPIVTFHEGMERSIGWLSFAGYPIKL